jgi:ABC-type multidrug transport system ATPase subunit
VSIDRSPRVRWPGSTDRSSGLVATGLVTGYAAGRRGGSVVTRADFAIASGSVVAVVGPNGAGKSTLLKTLVGLLPPLGGNVVLDGLQITEFRRQHGIGYLPEALSLNGAWTARGMLALAGLAGGRGAAAALPEALATAGVDFDITQPLHRMSKGMRQRVALAMTMLPPPRLLLLDEPEAGLDPAQRVRLRDRIRQFARAGRIVLVASHDLSGLCSIADATFLLSGQRMVPVDRAELAVPARLMELFGVEAP